MVVNETLKIIKQLVLDFLCHFSILFATRSRIAKRTENTQGLQTLLFGCAWV
ncbi:MAG: hypothetical protein A4E53_03049 [Pelotomaculum sp. PtaB.Bin104]|nr:MAG: hypothetical protein A4E53_03049 [Pelotomaculum sp. PtaB.Bin104]